METSENPFASPLAEEAVQRGGRQIADGLSADGKLLIAVRGAEFPDRCVKCNSPAEGYRLKRQLSWHSRWIFLLLLLNILIYLIVALVTRRQSKYQVGLCAEHRRKRRMAQAVWFGLSALGALATIAAIVLENPWPAVVGVPLGILALLIGLVATQVIHAQRITDSHAEIKGCGSEFLLSLT